MQANIHGALLNALATILRPLVKLLLQSGVSFDEFNVIAKTVFVHVASDDFRKRGRPANFSQVAAMTGIPRKDVSKIRDPDGNRWNPNMEVSPINTLLHQWHFDNAFSDGMGHPRPLAFEGTGSFSDLVSRHVHDLPPGSVLASLISNGVAVTTPEELVAVTQPFFYSMRVDEDFIRGIAFAWANLGSTLAHNAILNQHLDIPRQQRAALSRIERSVWSEHLTEEAIAEFKRWVNQAVPRFLEEANRQIGASELPRSRWAESPRRSVGLGMYYYEQD